MDKEQTNMPPEQNPAVHQQPNIAQNEGLTMNLNENPMANENVATTSEKPVSGDGTGVGSEITDGEAG
jgi:hypothetical protein